MIRHPLSAIVGLGLAGLTRTDPRIPVQLAVEAVTQAAGDAGLGLKDIDGLLVSASGGAARSLDLTLHAALELRQLGLLASIEARGSTAAQMVQTATMALRAGLATTIACVFADTPVVASGGAAAFASAMQVSDGFDTEEAVGFFGAMGVFALAAKRHMARYGTTQAHLGAVAIATRAWAVRNELAVLRKPITLADYFASRWIVEPLHLLDCAIPVNGSIALILTSAERATACRQPPVYVRGFGQGHTGFPSRRRFEREVETGAALSKTGAFEMAGAAIAEVSFAEIYDATSYSTLVALEDFGFCKKGEGGPFVADGVTAPGGSLPVNTGGGSLSGYYLQGMTPISEAVIQVRGQGGARQVPNRDLALVSCSGNILMYNACLLLSPDGSPW